VARRLDELHSDDTDRKKFLEDEAKEYIPVGSELELTNQPDWKSSSQPLVAEFHVKISGWVSGAGHRALFPVGVFSATDKSVFEHADRVHPIYMEFPFEKTDDLSIDLPAGWQVQTLPPTQNNDKHVVAYEIKAEKGGNSLHLTRKLKVDFMMIDTKYYPALRNFFQTVKSGDEEQIVLEPAAASASK
jgi:hypothetical protein